MIIMVTKVCYLSLATCQLISTGMSPTENTPKAAAKALEIRNIAGPAAVNGKPVITVPSGLATVQFIACVDLPVKRVPPPMPSK